MSHGQKITFQGEADEAVSSIFLLLLCYCYLIFLHTIRNINVGVLFSFNLLFWRT